MAPRPAFLSGLGGGTTNVRSGLKPPTQMDRDRENRQLPDTSRPAFLSDLGGGVPTGLRPPSQRDTSPFVSRVPSVDELFTKNNIAEGTTSLGTGSAATGFANPGGMPGSNKSQQFLGDNYNRFLALGYTPSEIDAQLDRALSFGRGIDVDKIENQLDKFEQFNASGFNESGVAPLLEDFDPFTGETTSKNFLSVSRPEIYANPGEGLGSLLESLILRPIADTAAAIGNKVSSGELKPFIMSAADAIGDRLFSGDNAVFNPSNLSERLKAAGPEAQRKYAMLLQQQVPYQMAFEQATGQKLATGGIATLQ